MVINVCIKSLGALVMLVIFIVETRRFRSEENCLGVRDERKERDVIVEEDWT